MLKLLEKLLYFGETLAGLALVAAALTTVWPSIVVNVVGLAGGMLIAQDGLERLDGPEHGRY